MNNTTKKYTRISKEDQITVLKGGVIIAKNCSKCGEIRGVDEFPKDRHDCKTCFNAARRKRYKNNRAKELYRNNTYNANNQHVYRAASANLNARKRGLIAELTQVQMKNLLVKDRCILTNVYHPDVDHFVALSTGHGGTYLGNLSLLAPRLNSTKHARNPFEWITSQPSKIQERFYSVLVPHLAELNGLSVEEFEDFVNYCYDNPRTVEEVNADTKLHSYIRSSIEIWKESRD